MYTGVEKVWNLVGAKRRKGNKKERNGKRMRTERIMWKEISTDK